MDEPKMEIDEPTVRRIFGGNLVARRERHGLTPTELADRAGVTPSELSEIEAGTGEPGAFIVARITEILGCDLDYLMGDMYWIPSGSDDGGGHYELD